MDKSVTVWDQKIDPLNSIGDVLCWQAYTEQELISSIPRYLETHAERLRKKYLEFIHNLGESVINGKSVVEHLDVGEGFSFWWMSQLAEKSPFKSPKIYDCLRLLALEEILLERRPHELILNSPDRVLANAMRALCQNLQINFNWHHKKTIKIRWSLHDIYHALPYPLQALISLRHLVAKWPICQLQRPQWFFSEDAVFMCSYFFNLDEVACNNGHFYSRQWEGLPECLQKSGKHINWVHHFLFSPGSPDVKTGIKWATQFNHNAKTQGNHSFIESFLSFRVILVVLKNWIWLNIISWRLRSVSGSFRPKGSAVWLWPLLRRDWQTSLTGPSAINNCLWLELFDIMFREMPYQKIGLYLWENQGWESALIRAWRRHGHGKIIGVPHATVNFWHLNNFDDPLSLELTKAYAKPIPEQLAVNGPIAWDAFVKIGYPTERLVEVEALRFQYLDPEHHRKAKKNTKCINHDESIKVLVLGDFTFKQTKKMLECLSNAQKLADNKILVTLKPHPVCEFLRKDCPELSFDLTDKPLPEIMQYFDLAFSSNTTSASVDALLQGLPVAVFLDGDDLNHSPLRGGNGVQFVATAEELSSWLSAEEQKNSFPFDGEFFWFGSRLPRWCKLLMLTDNTNA